MFQLKYTDEINDAREQKALPRQVEKPNNVLALVSEPPSECTYKHIDAVLVKDMLLYMAVGTVIGAVLGYLFTPPEAAAASHWLAALSYGVVGATFGQLTFGLLDVVGSGSLDDGQD